MLRKDVFSYYDLDRCPLIDKEGVFHFHTLKRGESYGFENE